MRRWVAAGALCALAACSSGTSSTPVPTTLSAKQQALDALTEENVRNPVEGRLNCALIAEDRDAYVELTQRQLDRSAVEHLFTAEELVQAVERWCTRHPEQSG